mmetsp:Transcript_6776/g.11133  ORF Transcript_6776/g.11133 Transcript_6776/m.11133 type:complete len:407 (-) Transcript_6776:815-2035(-)|eukprot:CAMPEP_0197026306 /NCGR_PEP_ID=MMETSP1384-20130603/6419_1 /TAXON_ID=29189 /ORGANISM="Ammonia sp." /LENGTH=406 /DNA_ID=CAMNT_0042454949 /DNA_START=210 /DNA_END=1430 /DNA_ORIENTATION=+
MDDLKDESKGGGDDVEEEKKESNLWRDFLKSAVKSGGRGQQNVGHLIVFGAPSAGKSTLVSQFGKLESKFAEMKKFLMMRYAYCHLTASDSEDSYSLLNIWQIAEPAHADVLEVVIPKEEMNNLAYLICLDVSKPSTVEQEWKRWIETAVKTQERLVARCDAEMQEQLKVKLFKHIQFYVNPKDDTEQLPDEEKEELDVQRKNPETNIGAPIIVVANKCETFRTLYPAEADAEDHFEIMCSYIRFWCLQYGAASFSMSKGLKDQARRILSYIDHRIFDSKFDRGPNAVVKLSNLHEKFLFIPSGFDSLDTIKAQNPNRNLEETPFSDFFKKHEKKKKHNATKPKMHSDKNDKFFRTVMFDLQSGDRTQVVRSGANTGGRDQAANGVDINDFFQRLLDPSQASGGGT